MGGGASRRQLAWHLSFRVLRPRSQEVRMSVVFDVTDVPSWAAYPLPEERFERAVEALLFPDEPMPTGTTGLVETSIEGCSHPGEMLIGAGHMHAAVAGVHWAFDQHRRLVLAPDAIWMLIVQGFSHHVAAHAEELRSRFVHHEGQLVLTVRRDDFVKGPQPVV
jgi:uncharacterized protein DUF4419